ncbi:MAG: ABC transporter ATP-binding protein [Clostridia bacterium]|nr:ABC transporter ATP-binding protein [Clostridia bacterium]
MPDVDYLSVRGVSKQFDSGGNAVSAIEDVSFDIARGSFVSILGPSGCGKSTLFNVIAGLLPPTAGDVRLGDTSIIGKAGQVGYMLQKDLLLPWRTIEDNITLGQTLRGIRKRTARQAAAPLIDRCGLAHFEKKKPHQLSGGMRQRAALLRTLLTGKDVLLLDEPFGALDAITRLQLQMTLIDVWQETRKTILFVTHDVDEALLLSDEIIVLTQRPGRVRARLTVDLPRPRTPDMLASPDLMQLKAQLMTLLLQEVTEP